MPFFTEDIKQGVKSFTDLNDTPASLVAGQTVRANATGTALEFYVPSGGGGGSSIDDANISTSTTYSSSKVVTELGTKANTTALNSYLPLAGGALTGNVTTNVPNGSFTATSLVSKNYVDNSVGGAAGATTYTALTDTPATHAANAILYSTGSAIAHTTTQIAIDGNGVEVNQLNARVDGTSNIGDSTHKFNTVFSGAVHQGNVKMVIPTTRGTTGQYVKVGNANAEEHTLEFADVLNDAAASSSTTYSSSKIDSTYLQQSKVKNSASTTAGDVYDVRHVDTQLGNKLATSVSNLGASGIQLHSVTGQTLSLKTLAGAGLASVTESGGIITVTGNADTNKADVTYVNTQVASVLNDAASSSSTTFSSSKITAIENSLISRIDYNINTNLNLKLSLTGGALTGHVTTNQTTFSNAQQLVTKQYVDAQIVAGGGASQFTQLTDTPSTYTANRFLKSTGSALDWFDLTSKTLTWDFYNALSDLPSASGNHGQIAHVHAEGAVYFAHNVSWIKIANATDADGTLTGCTLSGADLVFTRKNQSSILVQGVNPPALSFAVQGGTVSNNGATLQLTQTNGSPAAITGLTPSTVADGKTLTSGVYDLGAGSLAITQQDATSITITGCPRPLSSFSAGAASGNYYTPSFLNDRILPAVSSGTNQYVLGNDGTGALWLSTLQASANTVNIGTGTLKKFATWATGTFLEYFMKATPSNSDTLGSVAFSDTLLNNYATFSGKVDDNSTRAGHFSFNTAKSGTLTEQLIVGKSDHSNADAGQFAGTLKVAGVKFSGNTTQTKPVEDPATVGHVLTAGAGGTWSWAAASGGSGGPTIPNSKKIDQLKLSGNTITAEDGTTTYDAYGILWGDRYMTYLIENNLVYKRDAAEFEMHHLHNGYRATGFSPFDDPPHNCRAGGHVIWQHQDGLYLKLNALHFHYYNNGNPNMTMAFYGSNDRVTWTKLTEWNHNDATAYSNGYATTSYTIDGTSVSIPARGPSNLTKTVYNGSTVVANTNNSNGCRRYVFNNTNFYMFYMLKNTAANEHPNMNPAHNVSMDSQLEWEY